LFVGTRRDVRFVSATVRQRVMRTILCDVAGAAGRRTSLVGCVLIGSVAGNLVGPPGASAHGPCRCLVPTLGVPGQKVTIARTPAYKVIFNPGPAAFGGAMRQVGYQSSYEPNAPTVTVVSRPRTQPKRRATFHVPKAPPGVYLVLIFDGSERGTHTTWEYFHVLGRAPRSREQVISQARAPAERRQAPVTEDAGLSFGAAIVGVGALVVALGAGVALGRRWETKRS
jgi:hypothetical protein